MSNSGPSTSREKKSISVCPRASNIEDKVKHCTFMGLTLSTCGYKPLTSLLAIPPRAECVLKSTFSDLLFVLKQLFYSESIPLVI